MTAAATLAAYTEERESDNDDDNVNNVPSDRGTAGTGGDGAAIEVNSVEADGVIKVSAHRTVVRERGRGAYHGVLRRHWRTDFSEFRWRFGRGQGWGW